MFEAVSGELGAPDIPVNDAGLGSRGASVADTTTKAKVDQKVLDTYVGEYDAPFGVLVISRDGDKLYGAPRGEEKAELVAISETEFDVPSVGVKVKFVKDDSGKITHMVLNHEGQEMQAKKIK